MASFVNKKGVGGSSGGSSGRCGGGIVGAIVPPKKKVDHFPLMSYVANNCTFSDKGEESLDDEEVLKAYNDQRVNELLSEAAKSRTARKKEVVSDDTEERKKALEVLRSMEWSKNQEDTWKVVKSKKDPDYGNFLHPLNSKRSVKEDEYFSGLNNKAKKPKERKRSRSVSEVIVLDNGRLVPKNNPNQELPIKLNLPPRPVTPRVPSVGLPFTPGPPPTTTNNQWLQKSGSTLFSEARSNTILAYGINCDEEQAMALAIAESIRTAKCEQERMMNFVNPSGVLTVTPKTFDAEIQSKFPSVDWNGNENFQKETIQPNPQREQPTKALQEQCASYKPVLSTEDKLSDANNNKSWASWEDTNMKTEKQNLSQRSKYSVQVPSKPMIFLNSPVDNPQKKSVKAPDTDDQESKYSDCWNPAEPKFSESSPKDNSNCNPFQKILMKSYIKFDGKIDSTATLSPDSKNSLREQTTLQGSHHSQENENEGVPGGESHVQETFSQAPFSVTMTKATQSVRKLALEPNPVVQQTEASQIKPVAKQIRFTQDVASITSSTALGNQSSETDYEMDTSVLASSHNNVTTVKTSEQKSTADTQQKTQAPNPYIRRHRSFVIHNEIPGKKCATSKRSEADIVGQVAEAVTESQPLQSVEQTTPNENIEPKNISMPAQKDRLMHQQPSAIPQVVPSSNNPVTASIPLNRMQAQEMANPMAPLALPPVLPSLTNPLTTSMPLKMPEMPQAQDMAQLMAAQQQQLQLQFQMMLMQQAMGIIPPALHTGQNMEGVKSHFGLPQQAAPKNQVQNENQNLLPPSSQAGIHGQPNLSTSVPGYPIGPGMPNMMPPSLVNPLPTNMLGLPNGYPTGFPMPMMPNSMPGPQTGLPMSPLLNNYSNSVPGLPNVLQSNLAGLQNMVPSSSPRAAFPSGLPGYPNMMPPTGMQTNLNRPSIPGMLSGNSFNGLSSLTEPSSVPLVCGKGRGRLARNNVD